MKCAGVGAAKFSKNAHVWCGSVRSKNLLCTECAGVPKLTAHKYSGKISLPLVALVKAFTLHLNCLFMCHFNPSVLALAFSVSTEPQIMEELINRFTHLSEKIFLKLNYQSLVNCRETSRIWNKELKAKRSSYLKVIKQYTDCSDELLKKILYKIGSPIVLVSVLNEIFRKFPRGTKQRSKYLQRWPTTPLHMAAKNGHLAAYELIMESIEDKNPQARLRGAIEVWNGTLVYLNTPLNIAIENGQFSVIKIITENILEKNPPNDRLCTPLHFAAMKGNLEIFQFIFESINSNIASDKNPMDVNRQTPLHVATAYGHFDICDFIVSFCKNLSFTNDSRSPFHLAAANGHAHIYQLLIEKTQSNGNFLTQSSYGQIPLHFAVKSGHLDVCKLILQTSEKRNLELLDYKDRFDCSPFQMAIRNKQLKISNYFFKYVKDIEGEHMIPYFEGVAEEEEKSRFGQPPQKKIKLDLINCGLHEVEKC